MESAFNTLRRELANSNCTPDEKKRLLSLLDQYKELMSISHEEVWGNGEFDESDEQLELDFNKEDSDVE